MRCSLDSIETRVGDGQPSLCIFPSATKGVDERSMILYAYNINKAFNEAMAREVSMGMFVEDGFYVILIKYSFSYILCIVSVMFCHVFCFCLWEESLGS